MIARLAALAALCWCLTANAETARVFSDIKLSDDSDDQSQSDVSVGYQAPHQALGPGGYWATAVGHRRLNSTEQDESFDYLRLKGRGALTPDTGVNARLDLNHDADWSPVLGALAFDWRPSQAWRLEASAERDLVDTVAAVGKRTTLDTEALSADLALLPTLTLVGAVGYSAFSDGNDRLHRIARLVWSPAQWQWLMLQLRAKRADSDAVGIGYFNPRRVEEYEAQMRLAGSPFGERWVLSLLAGTGQQRIDSGKAASIYTLESRVRGWFNDHYGLEGRAACSNFGSLSQTVGEDSYRHCQLDLQFIFSW